MSDRPKPITRGVKAAITKHVASMLSAVDCNDLERRFQEALAELGFADRRLKPVRAAMVQRGQDLCAQHPRGHLVPRFGPGRHLSICGEGYRVARGQNSAGVRYAWTYAQNWARDRMEAAGLSITASSLVWGWWSQWPHRALGTIQEFDAGRHQDPAMNTLIRCEDGTRPIRCEIGEDDRAHPPCECGGTLFDWGCGWSDRIIPLSWRCNRCPAAFIEYVSNERLMEIRAPARAARLAKAVA